MAIAILASSRAHHASQSPRRAVGSPIYSDNLWSLSQGTFPFCDVNQSRSALRHEHRGAEAVENAIKAATPLTRANQVGYRKTRPRRIIVADEMSTAAPRPSSASPRNLLSRRLRAVALRVFASFPFGGRGDLRRQERAIRPETAAVLSPDRPIQVKPAPSCRQPVISPRAASLCDAHAWSWILDEVRPD